MPDPTRDEPRQHNEIARTVTPLLPWMVPPEHSVTNAEFLRELFRGLPADQCAWITSFGVDPGKASRRDWFGMGIHPARSAVVADYGAETANTYCTFSSFTGEQTEYGYSFRGRRNSLFGAQYAIMLDDLGDGLGAKLSMDHLGKLEPSWVLETSPGNYQGGYFLIEPLGDRGQASGLINEMIKVGLAAESDPGMAGVCRYGRTPVGWNAKKAYVNGSGPPSCRLVHWRPDLRYSPWQICQAFGMDWQAIVDKAGAVAAGVGSGTAGGARASMCSGNARGWIDLVGDAVGRLDAPNDKGADGVWFDITCPWVHEHTSGEDTGTALGLCDAGGAVGLSCHHGHCIDRTFRGDVVPWLLEHPDPAVRRRAIQLDALEAFGDAWLAVPPPPGTFVGRAQDGAALPSTSAGPGRSFDVLRSELSRFTKESPPSDVDTFFAKVGREEFRGHLSPGERDVLFADAKDVLGRNLNTLRTLVKEAREQENIRQRTEANEEALRAEISAAGRTYVPLPVMFKYDWKNVNSLGVPLPTSGNVECVLHKAGGRVRLNEMSLVKEYSGAGLDGWSLNWVDRYLKNACVANGLEKGLQEMPGMTNALAEEDSYHPFTEWLDTLTWDGNNHFPALANTVKVPKGKEAHRDLILRKWLSSVIAAARHLYAGRMGKQPRGVLVFSGGQYAGKTTWLGRLFEGLFARSSRCFLEGAAFAGDRDSRMQLLRVLVAELGELDTTFSQSTLGSLKAFLSAGSDSMRKPYAAEVTDTDRRTVFCATVNDEAFLRDPTGNSRFWTIHVQGIDLDEQRSVAMAQVWAQIDHAVRVETERAEREGAWERPWIMSKEEIAQVERANDAHRVVSDIEERILDGFDWNDEAWVGTDDETPEEKIRRRVLSHPMRGSDIADYIGIRTATNDTSQKKIRAILIRLTGQPDTLNRRRKDEGGLTGVRGRYWGMPPKVHAGDASIGPPDV